MPEKKLITKTNVSQELATAPVNKLLLGLAPFVMQSTEALIHIAFNSSLQKYGGDDAVGAMTIASTVLQMLWIPSQGLGQGAQPIISYNYGAKNAKRVKEAFFAMLKVACIYLGVFWILVELFPQFFIKLFNNSSVELLSTATWSLRLYIGVMCLFGIQMSIQQTLLSIGKAKAALFIAVMRKVILLFPLIYILPVFFENKVFAVFLTEPVSDTLSIITASIVFYFVFGKSMREIETRTNDKAVL